VRTTRRPQVLEERGVGAAGVPEYGKPCVAGGREVALPVRSFDRSESMASLTPSL
jgi:hypothetical protein